MTEFLSNNLGSLVFLLVLPVAIAVGMSLVMHSWARKSSFRRKFTTAGLIAGLLPTLLPVVIIIITGVGGDETLIAVAALVIIGLIVAAAIGIPVSYFMLRRLGDHSGNANDGEIFR